MRKTVLQASGAAPRRKMTMMTPQEFQKVSLGEIEIGRDKGRVVDGGPFLTAGVAHIFCVSLAGTGDCTSRV